MKGKIMGKWFHRAWKTVHEGHAAYFVYEVLQWLGPYVLAAVLGTWAFFGGLAAPLAIVAGLAALAAVLVAVRFAPWKGDIQVNSVSISVSDTTSSQQSAVTETPNAYVRDKELRIIDIPRDSRQINVVKHRTYEDCTLIGPAVLMIMNGTVILDCKFVNCGATPNSMFLPVRKHAALCGVIGLEGCTLRRCRIMNVAICGTKEVIAKMKAGLVVNPEA